jgi:hypothetical protein
MVIHRLFDQLSALGTKYVFFLYMWADWTCWPPFLVSSLMRNIGFHLYGPSERIGSQLDGPTECIGSQPDA